MAIVVQLRRLHCALLSCKHPAMSKRHYPMNTGQWAHAQAYPNPA